MCDTIFSILSCSDARATFSHRMLNHSTLMQHSRSALRAALRRYHPGAAVRISVLRAVPVSVAASSSASSAAATTATTATTTSLGTSDIPADAAAASAATAAAAVGAFPLRCSGGDGGDGGGGGVTTLTAARHVRYDCACVVAAAGLTRHQLATARRLSRGYIHASGKDRNNRILMYRFHFCLNYLSSDALFCTTQLNFFEYLCFFQLFVSDHIATLMRVHV